MLLKVLSQTLLADPFHWQLGCRTVTYFKGHHKPQIQPLPLLSWRSNSTSSSLSNPSKENSEEIEPVSLLGIKKQLKNANLEFIDGNCCLKTVCPACGPSADEATTNVYINKTTGMKRYRE